MFKTFQTTSNPAASRDFKIVWLSARFAIGFRGTKADAGWNETNAAAANKHARTKHKKPKVGFHLVSVVQDKPEKRKRTRSPSKLP